MDIPGCSVSESRESEPWPEGMISLKVSMNPYLWAMLSEEAYRQGKRPFQLLDEALWEKLGKPDCDRLMEFAANLEVEDIDPKWKKRLKLAARHEMERLEELANAEPEGPGGSTDGNGKRS